MPIEYKKNTAVFVDLVAVEEAEGLLGWLQNKPDAKVDLGACSHMHPANLQVLMAAKSSVSVWPIDVDFRSLLKTAMNT